MELVVNLYNGSEQIDQRSVTCTRITVCDSKFGERILEYNEEKQAEIAALQADAKPVRIVELPVMDVVTESGEDERPKPINFSTELLALLAEAAHDMVMANPEFQAAIQAHVQSSWNPGKLESDWATRALLMGIAQLI